MVTATLTGREGFGQSVQPRLNLGAITASAAAHVLVVALLAMTWREETRAEGGTRSALVSIDFAAQEGGPAPKKMPPVEAVEPEPQASTAPPTQMPVQHATPEPHPLPDPAPSPVPRPRDRPSPAELSGGGDGRTGQGSAAATTRPTPAATPVPVPASLFTPARAAAPAPAQRGQDGNRNADTRGTGGTGGGRSDKDGNSEASNYEGRVYQHLLRYRQTNTIGSGKVLVAFTVEPEGTARNMAVARSSGSVRFDREGLQLVRRAAPFPRPPDRATHRFTFEITGQ